MLPHGPICTNESDQISVLKSGYHGVSKCKAAKIPPLPDKRSTLGSCSQTSLDTQALTILWVQSRVGEDLGTPRIGAAEAGPNFDKALRGTWHTGAGAQTHGFVEDTTVICHHGGRAIHFDVSESKRIRLISCAFFCALVLGRRRQGLKFACSEPIATMMCLLETAEAQAISLASGFR